MNTMTQYMIDHQKKYPEQIESQATKMLNKVKIRTLAIEQNPLYRKQEWRVLNKCIQEFYPTIEQVEQIEIMPQQKDFYNYNVVKFILRPYQTIGPYCCLKRINIKINQQFSDQEIHEVVENFKINNNNMKQEFFEGKIIILESKSLLIQNSSIPVKIQIYYEPDNQENE